MTQTVLSNRPALQGFCQKIELKPYQVEFYEDERRVMANKVRNNLASIHAQCFILLEHIDGFTDVLNNEDIDVSAKIKKQAHDLQILKEKLSLAKSAILDVIDDGMKISSKDDEKKRNDAVEWNYDIVNNVLKIAMDCEHDGGFNNNGKVLVEMDEKLFNQLKIPHFALKQMTVYGSIEDRMDQFID